MVPTAYVLACIAAGLTVAASLFGIEPEGAALGSFTVTAVLMTLYAGAFSFVPALIAVLLAEAFRWRALVFYLLAGGGIGLAAHLVTGFVGPPALLAFRLVTYLAAGFVSGFVYWLVAGRRAGPADDRRRMADDRQQRTDDRPARQ